jgi:serine-type D-Ala-D-Ala carboxypeptidase/endopeptidase (penicillin-binding protein 4)
VGAGPEEMVAVDGSGLDRGDRLTCGLLQRVLATAGESGPLAQGLPQAGRNGTLFRRFLGTPAAGKVRAKTGSLEGVVGLSGFVSAQAGRTLAFSLLANDLPSMAVGAGLQDRVANVMSGYPRAPTPEELGPKPPAA